MFGSPEIFPNSSCGVFFLNCIPFKARCALSIFPVLPHCVGRGKQTLGSVVTKGKKIVQREVFLAFVSPGSCGSLNRQKLTLHRKFRMGTHDGLKGCKSKKYGTAKKTIHRPFRSIPLLQQESKKGRYSLEQQPSIKNKLKTNN